MANDNMEDLGSVWLNEFLTPDFEVTPVEDIPNSNFNVSNTEPSFAFNLDGNLEGAEFFSNNSNQESFSTHSTMETDFGGLVSGKTLDKPRKPPNLESRLQEILEKKGVLRTEKSLSSEKLHGTIGFSSHDIVTSTSHGAALTHHQAIFPNFSGNELPYSSTLSGTSLHVFPSSSNSHAFSAPWKMFNAQSATFIERVLSGPPQGILREKLLALAEAVATNDEEREFELKKFLGDYVRTDGSPLERLTYYCIKALDVKNGRSLMPPPYYSNQNKKKEIDELFRKVGNKLPFFPVAGEATVSTILESLEGHERIHIIDFGSMPNIWTTLLRHLGMRKNTCSNVRLTIVQTKGDKNLFKIDVGNLSRELESVAWETGLSFQICMVHFQLENLNSNNFLCHPGETLVINSMLYLQQFPDASVLRFSPRDKILQMFADLNPALVIVTEVDINLNINFFLPRFRKIVESYESLNDSIEEAFAGNRSEIPLIVQYVMEDELVNTVATEGLNRWCRPEAVDQWIKRFKKAGFAIRPFSENTLRKLSAIMRMYPDTYSIDCTCGGVKLLYKEQPHVATMAFRLLE